MSSKITWDIMFAFAKCIRCDCSNLSMQTFQMLFEYDILFGWGLAASFLLLPTILAMTIVSAYKNPKSELYE